MDEKEFTVAEIAQLGFDKFSIPSSHTEAFERQIRNKIKENNIMSVGSKKTKKYNKGRTSIAKNPAKSYSEDDKDQIINNLLFDYLKNLSNDESVKAYKSQSEYEEMAVIKNANYPEEFEEYRLEKFEEYRLYGVHEAEKYEDELITVSSRIFVSKKESFISEALYSIYFSTFDFDDLEKEVKIASELSKILQSDFMKEKMFLLHYEYDEAIHLEDIKYAIITLNESVGVLSGDDIRLLEKLKDWKNYIKEK